MLGSLAEANFADYAIGIVGLLIGLLAIAFALRHIRDLRGVREEMQAAQAETQTLRQEALEAFRIHDVLVSDRKLNESVQHMAEDFARMLERRDPLLEHLARRDIGRAAELVHMAAEGQLTIPENAFLDVESLASTLLHQTCPGDEFWASSLVHPAFWGRAAEYLRQQQDKVTEGVAIHRVFVFESENDYLEAEAQMQRQHDAGIKVSYTIGVDGARDLVVARKDRIPGTDAPADGQLAEAYAAEFRVGWGRRIEHIDLWTASGVHSERVRQTWWNLQSIFDRAEKFEPRGIAADASDKPSPAESTDPLSADE
jgi:uncharacterized membrane-anchored protein YhcB (DUF1043 family)